jgi:hypothetical protein
MYPARVLELRVERGLTGALWRSFVGDRDVSVYWRLDCCQIYLWRRILSECEDGKERKQQKGGHGRSIIVVRDSC